MESSPFRGPPRISDPKLVLSPRPNSQNTAMDPGGEPDGSLSPHAKRLKPSPPSRGKQKQFAADPTAGEEQEQELEQEQEQEQEERCGICLTEAGRSIRGRIDSCEHHFCFVCIMEWAKIESRCPLCKQRFGSIRRPAVPGLFTSERILRVSERNQVYHPLGIESSAMSGMSPNLNCVICHSSRKDAYLLLCELCSSTCHTHCVGLGADIPEGEWYCPDCMTAKTEYLKTQPDDDESPIVDQETKEKIRKIRQGGSSVSISDYVANLYEDATMNSYSVPYSIHRDIRPLSSSYSRMERIQRLRANWDRLRSGELQFSSDILRPNCRSEDDVRKSVTTATGSELMTERSRETDASRAWKMMDMAKSASLDRVIRKPSQSRSQPLQNGNVCSEFRGSKQIRKEMKGKGVCASACHSNPSVDSYSNGYYNFSKETTARSRFNKPGQQQLGPLHGGTSFRVKSDSNRAGQADSVHRVSGREVKDLRKRKGIEVDRHLQEEMVATTSDRRDGDKDEVQTLVKLSLKALDKDKKLGTNRFKEIARISTHTILAACGMEHAISVARPFHRVPCNHRGEMASHLLPGSCRQCFHALLQEIVKSVYSEKSGRVGPG